MYWEHLRIPQEDLESNGRESPASAAGTVRQDDGGILHIPFNMSSFENASARVNILFHFSDENEHINLMASSFSLPPPLHIPPRSFPLFW